MANLLVVSVYILTVLCALTSALPSQNGAWNTRDGTPSRWASVQGWSAPLPSSVNTITVDTDNKPLRCSGVLAGAVFLPKQSRFAMSSAYSVESVSGKDLATCASGNGCSKKAATASSYYSSSSFTLTGAAPTACDYWSVPVATDDGIIASASHSIYHTPSIQGTVLTAPKLQVFGDQDTWKVFNTTMNPFKAINGTIYSIGCSDPAFAGKTSAESNRFYVSCAYEGAVNEIVVWLIEVAKDLSSAQWTYYTGLANIATPAPPATKLSYVGDFVVMSRTEAKDPYDTVLIAVSQGVYYAKLYDGATKPDVKYFPTQSSGYYLRIAYDTTNVSDGMTIYAYTINMPANFIWAFKLDGSAHGKMALDGHALNTLFDGSLSVDNGGDIWMLANLANDVPQSRGRLYQLTTTANAGKISFTTKFASNATYFIGTGAGLALLPGKKAIVFDTVKGSLQSYDVSKPSVPTNFTYTGTLNQPALNSFAAPYILSKTGDEVDAVILLDQSSIHVIPASSSASQSPETEPSGLDKDIKLPVAVLIIVGAFLVGALLAWVTGKLCCGKKVRHDDPMSHYDPINT